MKEVVQDTLVPDQFADFLSIRLSDGLQKQPGLLVDTCSVLVVPILIGVGSRVPPPPQLQVDHLPTVYIMNFIAVAIVVL